MGRMPRLIALASAVFGALLLAGGGRGNAFPGTGSTPSHSAGGCDRFPPAVILHPADPGITGEYSNRDLCYSMTLPPDVRGYEGNPGTAKGLGIVLSPEPSGYLHAGAEPNSLDSQSSQQQARKLLTWLKRDAARVVSADLKATSLDGLAATAVTVRYTCEGSADEYVFSSVIALSPRKSVVYEVSLFAHDVN